MCLPGRAGRWRGAARTLSRARELADESTVPAPTGIARRCRPVEAGDPSDTTSGSPVAERLSFLAEPVVVVDPGRLARRRALPGRHLAHRRVAVPVLRPWRRFHERPRAGGLECAGVERPPLPNPVQLARERLPVAPSRDPGYGEPARLIPVPEAAEQRLALDPSVRHPQPQDRALLGSGRVSGRVVRLIVARLHETEQDVTEAEPEQRLRLNQPRGYPAPLAGHFHLRRSRGGAPAPFSRPFPPPEARGPPPPPTCDGPRLPASQSRPLPF